MALTKVSQHLLADDLALPGNPTVATQSASDNSTKIATTAYVTTAISNLVDGAPSTLNTLNEIAAALNDDAALNTTLTNSIATKLPLAGGTLTGDLTISNATPTLTFTDTDNNLVASVSGASGSLLLKADTGNGTSGESMQFHTGGSESMRIDGSGNLSLGTTSHVNLSSSTVEFTIGHPSDTANNGGGISFAHNSSTLNGYLLGQKQSLTLATYSTTPLLLLTNNTERMRIDSSGNVGIGESSPQTPLHISSDSASGENIALQIDNNNTTAGNEIGMLFRSRVGTTNTDFKITGIANAANDMDLVFQSDGQTERMRIDSSGRVGLGTNAPQSLLETNLHSGSASSLMNANAVNDVHLIRAGYGQNAGTTSNAGAKWGLRFVGRNDLNYDNGKSAAIYAVSEDGGAGYNREVGMAFHVSDFDANHAEAMRIDSDGNVGIGTASPAASLDVNGSLKVLTGSTGASNQASLNVGTTTGENLYVANTHRYLNGAGSEQMRIIGTSVGIGATSPTEKLEVDGGVKISNSNSRLYFGTEGGTSYRALEGSTSGSLLQVGEGYTDIALQGNVGIGTVSPSFRQHVYHATTNVVSRFESGDQQVWIDLHDSNSGNYGALIGHDHAANNLLMIADQNVVNRLVLRNSGQLRLAQGTGAAMASYTDSGAKQYSHLCTGSFYSSTGAVVIETNIPSHNSSNNANMFTIKVRGYEYAIHGSVDLNIGCYAGENQYYSANYNSNYICDGWRGNVKFAKNDSTGKLAIILGTTSSTQRCELAVVDFIQGFQNVNMDYADGWSMSLKTSLSNYSQITDCEPRRQNPGPSFHAYPTSSISLGSGHNATAFGTTSWNEGGHYNTSTGKFTAPTDGIYQFNMCLQVDSNSTNYSYLSAEVRLNGSIRYIGGWFSKYVSGGSYYAAATGSVALKMNRNDYVEFYSERSAGLVAMGGSAGYTYLNGVQVG